jgi:hypothetical protein
MLRSEVLVGLSNILPCSSGRILYLNVGREILVAPELAGDGDISCHPARKTRLGLPELIEDLISYVGDVQLVVP